MTEKNLIEVRCPFKFKSRRTGRMHSCNRICVWVSPGSKGEVLCTQCKKMFSFDVSLQSDYKTSVEVKREEPIIAGQ